MHCSSLPCRGIACDGHRDRDTHRRRTAPRRRCARHRRLPLAARRSLDIALYDVRFETDAGALVLASLLGAVQRGVAVRLLYNVAHPGPIPVPPPPETTPGSDRGAPRPDTRHRGRSRPHAPQVRRPRRRGGVGRIDELDGRLVVAPGERHRDARVAGIAYAYTLDFDQLWDPATSRAPAGSIRDPSTSATRASAPGSAPSTARRSRIGSRSTSARRSADADRLTRAHLRPDPRDARRDRERAALRCRRGDRRHAGRPGLRAVADERSERVEDPAPPERPRGRAVQRQDLRTVDSRVGARLHAREGRRRRRHVFVGSFNFSRSGERNAENVLEIRDRDVANRLATFVDEIRGGYPRATPPGSSPRDRSARALARARPDKPDYAGLLDVRRACRTRRTRRSSTGVDVAIVGAPTDDLVSDRPGTRFGPRAIRAASCPPGPHLEAKVDAFAELRVVDFGDAPVVPADPARTHAAIERDRRRGASRPGAIPIVLGGDHSIAEPDIRAVRGAARPGRARPLRHAHRHRHGGLRRRGLARDADVPARRGRARRPGALRPDRAARLLARRARVRLAARARDHELLHARRPRARDRGRRRARRSRSSATGPVFLSVDVDVLDPAFAPGTGTPEPGGMTTADLLWACRELGGSGSSSSARTSSR